MPTMDPRSRWAAGAALAGVLAGIVLFGGVQPEARSAFAAALLALSAALLLLLPAEHRPGRTWVLAAAALPAWLLLQLVPLPRALVAVLSPTAARWTVESWPGPLAGCGGTPLVGPVPSWIPLSTDAAATWEFLFQVAAALALFLAARAFASATGTPAKRALLVAVAAFTAVESAYGLVQWLSGTPHVLWIVKRAYVEDATGTLVNRNHFAMLLYIGLGATLVLLEDHVLQPARIRVPGRETAIRATLGLALGLQLAGIAASKSRGGLFGAAIVLVAAAPLLKRLHRGTRIATIALLAVVLVPTLLAVAPQMAERVRALPVEWTSPAGRGAVFRLSGRVIGAFALTGSGGGTFETTFNRFRDGNLCSRYDYAHDDYVQQLIETGVPGLAFALLPVALFAGGLLRQRREREFGDRAGVFAWPAPLYAAFAAMLVHEFADFGLHMPALSWLVAILAGTFAPREVEARASRRGAPVLAWSAAALAVPALLFGAARWPVVGNAVPWPDLADARQARADRALTAWSAGSDPGRACQAALEAGRAVAKAPLVSDKVATAARVLATIGASPGKLDEPTAARFRTDAARLVAIARKSNAWDAWQRERLMRISLVLGDLDQAADDAAAVAKCGPDLGGSLVDTLSRIGLPAPMIAKVIGDEPAPLQALLEKVLTENDLESAAVIVPKDVRPSRGTCRCGWLVSSVLQRAHGVSPDTFLRGCLERPEMREPVYQDLVRAWMASSLLGQQRYDEARRLVLQLAPGGTRQRFEIELAEHDGDWKAVVRLIEQLLAGPEAPHVPEDEAWIRYRLGRALARDGRISDALPQIEAAQKLNPLIGDLDRDLRELRFGNNPF